MCVYVYICMHIYTYTHTYIYNFYLNNIFSFILHKKHFPFPSLLQFPPLSHTLSLPIHSPSISIQKGQACHGFAQSMEHQVIARCFCGTPSSGRDVSDSFSCSWKSFSYWVPSSSLYRKTFALSYCILFCYVWLVSLGGLLLSERKQMGS